MGRERRRLDERIRAELGGRYVELSDGVTAVQLDGAGDGPPLVLLHGGTMTGWCFDEFVERVSEGRRVIRYDQYGRGLSDRPEVDYTPELYQRQLEELLEALEITGPVDLLGFSWGGAVAARFTHRRPERVRRLIFVSPVVQYRVGASQDFLARTGALGRFLFDRVGLRTVVRRAEDMLADHPRREQWMAAFEQQMAFEGFQRALQSFLVHALTLDYLPDYQAIGEARDEALLIWGTADAEIPRDQMQAIRDAIPGTRFVPLDGVGHGVFAVASARVADEVSAFLG